MAGEAYAKRYAAGFTDNDGSKPVDSQFLNAVETAILRLIGEDPLSGEVPFWNPALGRFEFRALADADIPAAIARDTEVTAAVSAHVALADPHAQYALDSEKGVANGYASLDGSGKVPAGQLPITGDTRYYLTAEVDVGNTVVETALVSQSIGAGVMSTNKMLRCTIIGDFLQNTAGDTFTLRIKLGATTLWASAQSAAMTADADRSPFRMVFEIANLGVANSQFMAGVLMMSDRDQTPVTTGIGRFSSGSVGFIAPFATNGVVAVDTTVAQTLAVTAQWNSAAASRSIRKKYALIEVV